MAAIEAYPLQWPDGWKRTESYRRTRARFVNFGKPLTVMNGIERVIGELRLLRVLRDDVVISTNLRTRLDGWPRSDQGEPGDPGAAVYWEESKAARGELARRVMAIDRYDRVADNLAAIAATLESLRAIERHGGAAILDRAFTGFTALPAPGQTSAPGWREVFGFTPSQNVTRLQLEGAYRTARSETYPRAPGVGDSEKFQSVQRAYEQGLAELGTAPALHGSR
jgi:hypothetical protein